MVDVCVRERGKDIQITHRAGKENVHADTLSRSPQAPPPASETMEIIVQVVVVDTGNLKSLVRGDPTPTDALSDTNFAEEQQMDQWIHEVDSFLKGKLLSNETRAHKIAAQAPHYSLVPGIHYYIDPRKRSCNGLSCRSMSGRLDCRG